MAKEVFKKTGEKEPFDAEKIRKSISLAAEQAGLPEERRNEVVEEVIDTVLQMTEGKEEIATPEIRKKILSELDSLEPSVSEAWRKYDQEGKAF